MTRNARSDATGGSLRARREGPGRTQLLAIDAGGRYRMAVSRIGEEDGWSDEVAGSPVRVVREVKRTTTVVGQLNSLDHVEAILSYLDDLDARVSETFGRRWD